jgi:1,4-alpha-glucan branching enzyme
MLKKIFLFTALIFIIPLNAQISCSPVFPGPDDDIVITFDSKQGSGGLANETGDVYAHTGVITDKSTSLSDWKFVKFPWTTNDASVKMNRQANGIYTLSIPKVRTFYGVPATDKIQKLAFVFRNTGGTKEGKTTTGGDIYYDFITDFTVLQTRLVEPLSPVIVTTIGQKITVKAAATLAGNVSFTDNGQTIASATNVKDLSHEITTATEGGHIVRFKVESGTKVDSSASFTYIIIPNVVPTVKIENPPALMELGANFSSKGDSVTLLFQAPNKESVYVFGDVNNYKIDASSLMKKSVDGKTWWLTLTGLTAGQNYTYQYLVDKSLFVADPLSTLVLDPNNDKFIPAVTYPNLPAYPTGKTTGAVSVLQPGKTPYPWKIKNFSRPDKKDLIIYELLLRDFVARHDYQTLMDTLPYLKRLGITALELMPVNEFDGNESWGYNPSFHNALDKYYGSADKFKELIDKCHENGMAVIIDIVFNHASGNSPLAQMYWDGSKPTATSPFLNPTAPHPYSVFNDMNHSSEYTKNYVARCLKYWLTEYNIDGYRFDLSKGFTQNASTEGTASNYDQSRIDNLTYYHNIIQTTSPSAYIILEHFAEPREETALAKAGMMVWGKATESFNEATMGYQKNTLAPGSSKIKGWNVDSLHNKYVAYMESHDEERLMVKNNLYGNTSGSYTVKDLATSLKRMELVSAFFYTIPGPRMLWQFGELGYDFSINFNGRVGNKPIRWDYLQDENRKRLFNVTQNLIHLRKTNAAFRNLDYNETDLNEGYLKAFHVKDADLSATVLGNFDVIAGDIVPNFQSTGKWYNYMTGDSITITSTSAPLRLLPGEYRVYTSKKLAAPPAGYIRFTPTATKEFAEEANDFKVYPNPSLSGKAYIGYNLRHGGTVEWTIFNTVGQQVTMSSKRNLLAGSYQDDMTTTLPQGIYFVKLSVNGAIGTRKIVVE